MTKSRWITAARVGSLFAVGAVAIANIVHTLNKVPPVAIGVSAGTFDAVAAHEERFAGVRASLQRRGLQGTIGYISDGLAGGDDYYYAQFALVPLVLDLDVAPYEWAVANFQTAPQATLPAGWHSVEDFGGGVRLLRKSAP